MDELVTSYIVRIYRRSPKDPRLLVGTVEEVGAKKKMHFTSFLELQEILRSRRHRPRGDRKGCTGASREG